MEASERKSEKAQNVKKAYSGFEKKDREKQTLKNSKMTLRARSNQLTAAKLFSGHDENMAHMKSQQGQLPAQGQASQNSRMDGGGIRKSHPWLNKCRQLMAASRG